MQTEERVLLAVQAGSIFYYTVDEMLKVDHDQLTIQLNTTEQYYQLCIAVCSFVFQYFLRSFFNEGVSHKYIKRVKVFVLAALERVSSECRKLFAFALVLTPPCDWLKKLAALFQPIRTKPKTNCVFVARVFPRLVPVTWIASTPDWFVVLLRVVIGHSNCLSFG